MAINQAQVYQRALENARYLDRVEKGSSFKETAASLKKITSGPRYKAPIEAFRLAIKLRKAVKNHEESPWLIAFSIALACDCMDAIPIAGWIISLFFRPFLFFFLWGKGTWKVKLAYYLILLLDFVPFINLIPLSTACVGYAYTKSRAKHTEAKEGLKVLDSKKHKELPKFKHLKDTIAKELKDYARAA